MSYSFKSSLINALIYSHFKAIHLSNEYLY